MQAFSGGVMNCRNHMCTSDLRPSFLIPHFAPVQHPRELEHCKKTCLLHVLFTTAVNKSPLTALKAGTMGQGGTPGLRKSTVANQCCKKYTTRLNIEEGLSSWHGLSVCQLLFLSDISLPSIAGAISTSSRRISQGEVQAFHISRVLADTWMGDNDILRSCPPLHLAVYEERDRRLSSARRLGLSLL